MTAKITGVAIIAVVAVVVEIVAVVAGHATVVITIIRTYDVVVCFTSRGIITVVDNCGNVDAVAVLEHACGQRRESTDSVINVAG